MGMDTVSNYPAVLASTDNRSYASDDYVAAKAAADCASFAVGRQNASEARDILKSVHDTNVSTLREVMEHKFQMERSLADIKATVAGIREAALAQALTEARDAAGRERSDRQFAELGGLLKTIIDKLPV